jgi:tRNA(Ile2) C34 agmatinyltransferase TiaS
MDDERPPICPVCGVTMLPAALSAGEMSADDWICVECEETAEPD